MQLGMVGLGKMGNYMTQRLIGGGHQVVAYDRDPKAVAAAVAAGATGASSLADMATKLTASPKVAWVMVPSGKPTEETIHELAGAMGAGGIIIDGGNTNYKDGLRLYADCKAKGVSLIDAGTSGGVWGLKEGYCLMVGGDDEQVKHCEPIFLTLAPPKGYAHVGPAGAGHFSKMVHNGIEYGLLQAYGEGFEILKSSQYDYDLGQLAELWCHASVVRSWLLELLVLAFKEDPGLKEIRGYVDDTGEGRWTVEAAIDENVPAPVITLSLMARMASRQDESFSAKVVAALRNQFGGHAVKSETNG
ncbi:MAG TPA: decarboxylating 6-phosphogluconate dehydrogenase [Candidatus Cybelea sp.]|nr:decarboxylating 6-phosphogluconate dehydrogenase [Candidatus Cybelea sp.]